MINRYIILHFYSIICALCASGQSEHANVHGQSNYIFNTGTVLNTALPASEVFEYEAFKPGLVVYRDGRTSEAKMNYSRLMDEMLFIGTSGDTLAIAEEPTLDFISIGADTFYWEKGYVLVVKNIGGIKLGVRQGFRIGGKRQNIGYDMMGSSSSVVSYSSIDDGKMTRLEVKEQVVVFKTRRYFIGDRFNRFFSPTRDNVQEYFPRCSRPLQSFVKKYEIDFSEQHGLEKLLIYLFSFCSG